MRSMSENTDIAIDESVNTDSGESPDVENHEAPDNSAPQGVDSSEETRETEGNENEETPENPDTFPRDYVEKLRDENAKYRQRAQRADDLAQRLHTALAGATGRLQDPSDLPFEESHLDDPEALSAAIDELLSAKPHLASRRPVGDVGQGVSEVRGTVDLAGLLRSRA